MEEDRLDREHDNDEENPYESLITNDFKKVSVKVVKVNTPQVEHMKILSNSVNYVKYNRTHTHTHLCDCSKLSNC